MVDKKCTSPNIAGKKLLYSYEKYGKLKSVKEMPGGAVLCFCTYNSMNLPVTETDALNSEISYTYDNIGRITSLCLSDKNGNVLRRRKISYNEAYNGGILLTVSEGSPALITEYIFDRRENLIRKNRIADGETRSENMTYDFFGNMLTSTTPDGRKTEYEYDIFGSPLKETLPDGNVNLYEYDFLGNMLSVTNPLGEKKEYIYDSLGRNIKTVFPCGSGDAVTKMYYDCRGNLTSVISPNGGKTENTYNSRGFLVKERVYSSADEYTQAEYTYDGEGNLASSDFSGTGGNVHTVRTYSLDVYGRPVKETDSLGSSALYEYDLCGNLIKSTDRTGRSISYVYDGAGRLLKKSSADGFLEYTYDEFDRVLLLSDGKETYLYNYNGFGELIHAQRGKTNDTYSYTPDGLLKSHTVADSDTTPAVYNYSYDRCGRLVSASMPGESETIVYDGAGRITEKHLASTGAEKKYTYYPGGMLKKQTTRLAGNIIFSEYCEYDKCGNKVFSDENGIVRKYRYDLASRLTGVDNHDGTVTEYEFDSRGNIRVEYNITDNCIEKISYYYDSENRLLMKDGADIITMQYDNAGNLIKKTDGAGRSAVTSRYSYDSFGRLVSYANDTDKAQYTYNPEGMRSSKTVRGVSTRFVYDGMNIISTVSEGSFTSYTRGTELISFAPFGGESLYFQNNSHGDVTALLTSDGTEKHSYLYNAYGKENEDSLLPLGENMTVQLWQAEVSEDNNPFRYCGEHYDDESGLIYLRNRYYDPSIGRFISEDPARDGLNWYAYCGNNPINCVDPWGLKLALSNNDYQEFLKQARDICGNQEFEFNYETIGDKYTISEWNLSDTVFDKGSPIGRSLIKAIITAPQVVFIEYKDTKGNGGYSFNRLSMYEWSASKEDYPEYKRNSILIHELAHAYTSIQGYDGIVNEAFQQYGSLMLRGYREATAISVEQQFRKEMGYVDRSFDTNSMISDTSDGYGFWPHIVLNNKNDKLYGKLSFNNSMREYITLKNSIYINLDILEKYGE